MKKLIALFIFITGIICFLNAQVKGPDRITGTYTGETKNELAHGKGTSVGKDTYTGNFKKGFPEGSGIYTFGEDIEIAGESYSYGDVYEGEFNKGAFDGKGKITYNNAEKGTLEGYWQNGKYLGRTRYGYEVLEKQNIVRVACINNGIVKNEITINGLADIIELGDATIEFDGISSFKDLPASKFPFILYIKGTVPSTGSKAELKLLIERPGTREVNLETN